MRGVSIAIGTTADVSAVLISKGVLVPSRGCSIDVVVIGATAIGPNVFFVGEVERDLFVGEAGNVLFVGDVERDLFVGEDGRAAGVGSSIVTEPEESLDSVIASSCSVDRVSS